MPTFGAAYAAPNKDTTFYTDLGLLSTVLSLQKIVEFKDFSRILSDFPVCFTTNFNFQESPLYSSTFQACADPANVLHREMQAARNYGFIYF